MEHRLKTRSKLSLVWIAGVLMAGMVACNALSLPATTGEPLSTDSREQIPTTPPAGEEPAAQASATPGVETAERTQPAPTGEKPAETASSPSEDGAAPQEGPGKRLPAVLPEDLSGINRYSIQVQIDYANHSFSGTQLTTFTNRSGRPLDELYFRLLPNGGASYGSGSLTVDRVRLDDRPASSELSQDGVDLRIPFPSPLEDGASVEVSLNFAGATPQNFGSGENMGYGIYNYSDGVLTLANWYPILAVFDEDGWNLDPVSNIGDSVYSEFAVYQVKLTVSNEVVLITTGEITEWQEQGENTVYLVESAWARDFVVVMGADFQLIQDVSGETVVTSYYLPGGEEGGRQAQEMATSALDTYSREIGLYPDRELDVVAVPMRYAAGVEYPGVVLIGSYLYADPLPAFFEMTVAHEVAHQWWYNVVGNDVFDDPWLDEGLTTYTSSLYYEARYGEAGYRGTLDYFKLSAGHDTPDRLNITDSLSTFETSENPAQYSELVYSKSAVFFSALRDEIGDDAFFEALENYYSAFMYQVAKPEDLLSAFETASGKELDGFYAEWLY